MVKVRINGNETSLSIEGLQKLTDFIELIKTYIDPAHIITSILVDGRELEEQEWVAPLSQFETAVLDIETGDPEEYVYKRLATSPDIIANCYIGFRSARKDFQSGNMQTANKKLLNAVNTLREFFSWYGTLLELLDEDKRKPFDIGEEVSKLSDICKGICQQQLYQSWWAIGETIEKELEPQLDILEDVCRKAANEAAQNLLHS